MRPENPGSQIVLLRLRGSSACRFVVNQMLAGISDLSENCFVKRPPRLIVTLLSGEGQIKASWFEVINLYQCRVDLVPHLLKTVRACAPHEPQVRTQVAEAGSRVDCPAAIDRAVSETAFSRRRP